MKLKEILKSELSSKESAFLRNSYDLIGDIAIVEIPKELEKKEKLVANAVMELNKSVKVVCKKVGITSGTERIRPVKVLFGENRTKTLYKENGYSFILDINKAYFTPRLSNERKFLEEIVMMNTITFVNK